MPMADFQSTSLHPGGLAQDEQVRDDKRESR